MRCGDFCVTPGSFFPVCFAAAGATMTNAAPPDAWCCWYAVVVGNCCGICCAPDVVSPELAASAIVWAVMKLLHAATVRSVCARGLRP